LAIVPTLQITTLRLGSYTAGTGYAVNRSPIRMKTRLFPFKSLCGSHSAPYLLETKGKEKDSFWITNGCK
jgi:hypothetical protein